MQKVKIGSRTIEPYDPPYVIAEAGLNHKGDVFLAKQLVDAAKQSRADCVKFQIFQTEKLIDPKEKVLPGVTLKNVKSQFDRLKQCELSDEEFREVAAYCKEQEIDFSASVWDEESLNLLLKLQPAFIKIGSGDMTNYELLKKAAATGHQVLLSTAGSTLEEIARSAAFFGKDQLILLHCTFPYPTPDEGLNLGRIHEIANITPHVGYSDHTRGIEACVQAAHMGAIVLEKHFVLDGSLERDTGDLKVSADPDELGELVEAMRQYSLRSKITALSEESKLLTRKARRAIYVTQSIKEGEQIPADSLMCIRPEYQGIPSNRLNEVIGQYAIRDLEANTFLQDEDIRH